MTKEDDPIVEEINSRVVSLITEMFKPPNESCPHCGGTLKVMMRHSERGVAHCTSCNEFVRFEVVENINNE